MRKKFRGRASHDAMEGLQPNAAGKNQFNAMELLVSKYKGLQQKKMVKKAPLLRFYLHILSTACVKEKILGADKYWAVETVVIVIVFHIYRVH